MNGRNGSKLDADLLTAAEIELLMRQCSRRAPTGVRNRALLAVLWRCGLRIGEALALAPKDLDAESGTLVVQRGKGGKRRVVGVDAGTVALVGRWLEVRRKRGIPAGAPLFCSLAGRPMTSPTSGTSCRGSRARPVSRSESTRTDYDTRWLSILSASEHRCTRSETPSGTQASRRRRSTCRASAPTRRSRRCDAGSGRTNSAIPSSGRVAKRYFVSSEPGLPRVT